jgi:RNA polymerase subunit RPABC4/transcription elongation factor Spt4
MEFLEGLLDFGDRKRRSRSGGFQNGGVYENHGDHDHDDDHDHHDHHQQHSNPSFAHAFVPPSAQMPGVVCQKCSTQIVPGARFCHGCGSAINSSPNCASCGTLLPANALFCPQCGFNNGQK